jgi:hypothetical protein
MAGENVKHLTESRLTEPGGLLGSLVWPLQGHRTGD